MRIWIILWSR